MQYRDVGTSDLKVSVLGMGCNNFGARIDLETTRRARASRNRPSASIISTPPTSTAAPALPKNHMGQVLGPRRKDIVLATKFGLPFDDSDARVAARASTS